MGGKGTAGSFVPRPRGVPAARSPERGRRAPTAVPNLADTDSLPMRSAVPLLALVWLATPSAGAQTCGGLLAFSLGERRPAAADSLRPWSASQYAIAATAVEARHVTDDAVTDRPPLDVVAESREVVRDTLRSRHDGLFWPRDDVRTWTRCGFALLRYEITARSTGWTPRPRMTLDLYNVPPHVGLEAEGLIPFRPGRWSFDFADGEALAAEALRREPE